MKTLFGLILGDCEGDLFLGVYSTQEQADSALSVYVKEDPQNVNDVRIVEIELDGEPTVYFDQGVV